MDNRRFVPCQWCGGAVRRSTGLCLKCRTFSIDTSALTAWHVALVALLLVAAAAGVLALIAR